MLLHEYYARQYAFTVRRFQMACEQVVVTLFLASVYWYVFNAPDMLIQYTEELACSEAEQIT